MNSIKDINHRESLFVDLKWMEKDVYMTEIDKANVILQYAIKDLCRHMLDIIEDTEGWEWVTVNVVAWYENAYYKWHLDSYEILDKMVMDWLEKEIHIDWSGAYDSREDRARMCCIDYFKLSNKADRELLKIHDRHGIA